MVTVRVGVTVTVMVTVRVRVTVTVTVTVTVRVTVKVTTNKDKFMTATLRETLMKTLDEIEATSLRSINSEDHIISVLISKNVFIRTVTHHYTGRLLCIKNNFLMLADCAWIADDGRFSTALEKGTFEEVEPFPADPVFIGLGAILDLSEFMHELPRVQK